MIKKTSAKILKIIAFAVVAVILVTLTARIQKNYFKTAYPIKYEDLVEKYSEEYGVDKFFVYAVIRSESDFNVNAKSNIGAKGLMQFTEETYNWVKKRLKDDSASFEDMHDAQKSIQYGVFLLSYLENTLGEKENVLCGYHAGINKTKQWLNDKEISPENTVDVEKIPYKDTKNYVKKVIKTYKIYSKLYSK